MGTDGTTSELLSGHGSGHSSKPPVTSAPSPNHASRQGKTIQYLVLHNTDGPGEGSLETLRDPKLQVSAHYMVDRDGTIFQLVQDAETAWHSGDKLINEQSIGIEVVAWREAKGMEAPQEASLVAISQYIVDAYDIKLSNIKSHRAVRPKPTDCPGWIWPTDADLDKWVSDHLR